MFNGIWKFFKNKFAYFTNENKENDDYNKRMKKLIDSIPANDDEAFDAVDHLYKCGYGDYQLEYLAKGAFGVVFKIAEKGRVVKYCKSSNNPDHPGFKERVSIDEMSIRAFNKMLQNIKDEKSKKWSKKYLSKVDNVNKKDIYEQDLALGDLNHITVNKRKELLEKSKSNVRGNKSLDSLLKKAKRIAKGVMVLHENGYVHQDIKPENIFQLKNPNYEKIAKELEDKFQPCRGKDKYGCYGVSSEKSEQDGKTRYFKIYTREAKEEFGREKSKISKHTINLADYGLLADIEEIVKNESTQMYGTPAYMSTEDINNKPTTKEDVMKRDVYALGITFFKLLCGRLPKDIEKAEGLKYEIPDLVPTAKGEYIQNKEKILKWYDNNDFRKIMKQGMSTPTMCFVNLINNMTCSRKYRWLIPAVIDEISNIQSKKNMEDLRKKLTNSKKTNAPKK